MGRQWTFLRICVAALLLPATSAAAQVPAPPRPTSAPVLLDTNTMVQKRLAEAADYLVDRRFAEAIDVIAQVSDVYGHTLIEVSPRRHLSVASYCQILLSRLPPAALEIYRADADPRAQRWYEEGVDERSIAPLQQILDEAFASSYGDDALWLLGEMAWEAGEPSQARTYWEMLLPIHGMADRGVPLVLRYPSNSPGEESAFSDGGGVSPAGVRARLVLCSLCEGATRRAELELERFGELHPLAEGELAGRRGRYVDVLTELVTRHHALKLPARCGPCSTLGGGADRNTPACGTPAVAPAEWSVELSTSSPDERGNVPWNQRLPREPARFPVSVDGRVLVCDGASISAYELGTGRPAWPVGDGSAVVYPPVPPARTQQPDLPNRGTPAYALTVDQGRLYARLGSPGSLRGTNEFRAHSELVCLDVAAGEGKLLWRIPESVLRPSIEDGNRAAAASEQPAESLAFEGAPLVVGERLYVAARRGHPQVEAYVACFGVESGALFWLQRVCTSLSPTDASQNRVSHQLLAAAGDRIYYCTDLGAVASLSCRSGRLEWVHTYDSTRTRTNRSRDFEGRAAGVEATQGIPSRPLTGLVANGTFFVAPADSDHLLAIRAGDGILLWERRLNDDVSHLLGYLQGRLFVSGRQLWSLNAYSGEPVWNFGYSDPAGYGFGRGFLTVGDLGGSPDDDRIYWPTREEIFVLRTDRVVEARLPLMSHYGLTGGNLLAAEGRLIVAGPERLTVFGRSTDGWAKGDLTSSAATREDEDKKSE